MQLEIHFGTIPIEKYHFQGCLNQRYLCENHTRFHFFFVTRCFLLFCEVDGIPFLKQNALAVDNNRFPLYRRMVKPGWENLFFMGLAQPLPTLVNLAEQQSKFVAAVILDRYKLPTKDKMEARIIADEKKYLGHFYDSERHTIQVDFNQYVRDLKKELGIAWCD